MYINNIRASIGYELLLLYSLSFIITSRAFTRGRRGLAGLIVQRPRVFWKPGPLNLFNFIIHYIYLWPNDLSLLIAIIRARENIQYKCTKNWCGGWARYTVFIRSSVSSFSCSSPSCSHGYFYPIEVFCSVRTSNADLPIRSMDRFWPRVYT